MTSSSLFVLALLCSCATAMPRSDDTDVGYELLFTSAPEEFTDLCMNVTGKGFPDWAAGNFVISSIGLLEMGGRRFEGVLDSFGKMHSFRLDGARVCATFQLMRTGFLKESMAAGTIGPGLLFYETIPERKCPLFKPLCNLQAPNDNAYVLTINLNKTGELLSTTDSTIMSVLDPISLNVTRSINIGKEEITQHGELNFLASAHPLQHPQTGEWVDFLGLGNSLQQKTKISAYSMSGDPSIPNERNTLAELEMDTAPYMHSFGMSQHHLVFPHMPIQFKMDGVFGKTMASALADLPVTSDADPNNAFYVAPLNGSAPFIRHLPAEHKLYYVHTANTYENTSGIVIDLTVGNENPFAGALDTVSGQLNKTSRDSTKGAVLSVKRFLLPWDSTVAVSTEVLSDPKKKTEFPKINPGYQKKKHCYYWGLTWFNDLKSYASMAVVKQNVCKGGQALQWTKRYWYPSEPMMIPSPGGLEDEGLIVFTAVDGVNGHAYLVSLDATTMEEVSRVGPYSHIPYPAHGAFYPVS